MGFDIAHNFTINTAPAAEPVTQEFVKSWIRYEENDEDDIVDQLITAARKYLEGVKNRTFVTTDFTFTLDYFPVSIIVPRPPLQSVTSIQYVDTDGDTQTLASSGYRVSTAREPAEIRVAFDEVWPSTRDVTDAVTIRVVAGYGAASTVPDTDKQAICLLVGHWFKNRESTIDKTLSSIPDGLTALIANDRMTQIA